MDGQTHQLIRVELGNLNRFLQVKLYLVQYLELCYKKQKYPCATISCTKNLQRNDLKNKLKVLLSTLMLALQYEY
jgi:hypothetical protein